MVKISTRFIKYLGIRLYSKNTFPIAVLNRKGKLFHENENQFAHNVLSKLPKYRNTIVQSSLLDPCFTKIDVPSFDEVVNWKDMPIEDVENKFKLISLSAKWNSIPISDRKFNVMCNSIAGRSSEISDNHLLAFLNYLSLWPFGDSPKEDNFFVIWKAFDNMCLARWKSWDVDKVLLFTDAWYRLHLIKRSDFVYHSIKRNATRLSRLLPYQLVQILFYMNTLRNLSKSIEMFEVEYHLVKLVDQLSTEELGVAVMGFHKTQNIIRSEALMNHIIDRIINDITIIPEFTLTSFIKVLRGSLTISIWDRISELMDSLLTQLDRFSLQCIVHINLLAAKCLILHKGILIKLCEKLNDCIHNARLKDLEKAMFLITFLNFKSDITHCLIDSIVKEMYKPNRMKEFDEYPKSLVALVYYLTLRNVIVENVVAKVLDMGFIRQTYGKTNFVIGREILGIDSYIEVMQAKYSGPRIPVDIRNYLSKRYSMFFPDPTRKLSTHQLLTNDIYKTCRQLFEENCITYKYILPHSPRADIVLHLCPKGRSLPLSDEYNNIQNFTGPIRAPDDTQGVWYALVVASRNMYLHNVPVLTGETTSKLDLIEKLGYKPILISIQDWPKNEEEKNQYLWKLTRSI